MGVRIPLLGLDHRFCTSVSKYRKLRRDAPVPRPEVFGSNRPSADFEPEFVSTLRPTPAPQFSGVLHQPKRFSWSPKLASERFARSQRIFPPIFTSPGAMCNSTHLANVFPRLLIGRFSLDVFGWVLCDSAPTTPFAQNPAHRRSVRPIQRVSSRLCFSSEPLRCISFPSITFHGRCTRLLPR